MTNTLLRAQLLLLGFKGIHEVEGWCIGNEHMEVCYMPKFSKCFIYSRSKGTFSPDLSISKVIPYLISNQLI